MSSVHYISLRFWSMLKKEFIQIKRDYITYIFLIMVPFAQAVFFGYVMNSDAKHLPTVIISYDSSPLVNSFIAALKNTSYFDIEKITQNTKEANKLLEDGKISFIVTIPENFTRDFIRNKQPHVLIEGDGSDPVAVTNAFHAANQVIDSALQHDLQGALEYNAPVARNIVVDLHSNYNPALLAQYHTLPGLLAALLTMTLTMITAISISSEFESGNMEVLLITPITPLEVIIGKIVPHLILGYILFFLVLGLSYFVFGVPFYGSLIILTLAALPFIICNLGVGVAVSTISKTQFRAANMTNSYVLPAILLSGFLFPFHAMPNWAQWIGELFPVTHFIRIIKNIMIKDVGFASIWTDLWPILLFMVIIVGVSFRFFRRTLD